MLTHTERTVTFTLDGSTGTFGQEVTTHSLTGTQTLQLGRRLRTRASFNASPTNTDGLLPAQAGTDSPDSTFDVLFREPNWTLSGTADLLASSTVFVSGRIGYTLKDLHTEGVGSEPRFSFPITNIGLLDVPPQLERVTGYLTDSNTAVVFSDRLSRLSAKVDATWYVRAWGEHALKPGVQADWSANDV